MRRSCILGSYRDNMSTDVLRLPAIEIRQGPNRRLYSFAVDGKLLPTFCTVSRVHRDERQSLAGYQRPEVAAHIRQIRSYLESDNPLLPNAIVVAFDDRVRFEPVEPAKFAANHPSYAGIGTLVIPVDSEWLPEAKPDGSLTDNKGRQRCGRQMLNASRSPLLHSLLKTPGNIGNSFILVNSTKPLPKGLIYELLPSTDATLPTLLARRRYPAELLERLNFDPGSPFQHRIQTPTNPQGIIKDNSILKMLEHSLTEGVLHDYRDSLYRPR
jgi:DGQHR domain-containing protein